MIRTQYTIRPTVLTTDTRAAADACNRELASAGDASDRRAVEEKLAECAPSLREWLTIDAEEIEAWEAWEDGARDEALGVDVSEQLNVARV